MLRFAIILVFSILSANAVEDMGKNGGGCTLSQEGSVKVYYKQHFLDDVKYVPTALSGKNFREIFIDSVIHTKNIKIKLLDYIPNKRVKGKPKTGIFIAEVTKNSKTTTITMTYIFDAGIMSATGVLNKSSIGFETNVKYALCSVSIK